MTRIVYLGSGAFGLPTLDRLSERHEIALVVSRPDRLAGRRQAPRPTPVAAWAADRGVPLFQPETPNDPVAIETIVAADPEAMVVIAYGHKLGETLLGERFALNLHASLLPRYRGAAPIAWAMIRGERETGVSVITLAQRMDAGRILAQAPTAIDPRETAGELHDRLAAFGPDLVEQVLADREAGTLAGRDQDPALVSQAPKLAKADGTVEFDQPADAVRARTHGLTPWPGCSVEMDGRRLRLHRVEVAVETDVGHEPGACLPGGWIACAPGAIRLLEVHPPGKKLMSFEDYQRGHRMPEGARCVSA